MEQHAIPQQISSYQFRLVGDMTLKQFFQLAGGFLVALIFYSTPLLPIIKWPIIIISSILGIALAFLPLEERPLEKWIFAFFRAIYAPTEYFWKKTITEPKFYLDESAAAPTPPQQDEEIKKYLGTPKETPLSTLENAEKGFFAKLTSLISGTIATPVQPTATPLQTASIQAVSAPVEPKREMVIPQNTPVKISTPQVHHLIVEEKPVLPQTNVSVTAHQVAPIIAGNEMISTKEALFSIDAAPPNPPTTPNVIVGQVVDQDRKIVEGAIMEIRDAAGRPIRALRSNRAGHFIIVTPLDNGNYDIITEKEGYEFIPVSFEAKGQLIPPILIKGHRSIPLPQIVEPIISKGVVINKDVFVRAGQN